MMSFFNNKDILCGKDTILIDNFLSVGMWYVSDLFENNNLIPYTEWVKRGYLKANFLHWMRIVDNIKVKKLERLSLIHRGLSFVVNGKIFNLCGLNVNSKLIYIKFIDLLTMNVYSNNEIMLRNT